MLRKSQLLLQNDQEIRCVIYFHKISHLIAGISQSSIYNKSQLWITNNVGDKVQPLANRWLRASGSKNSLVRRSLYYSLRLITCPLSFILPAYFCLIKMNNNKIHWKYWSGTCLVCRTSSTGPESDLLQNVHFYKDTTLIINISTCMYTCSITYPLRLMNYAQHL